MTCRANRRAKQKQIQSKGQAKNSNQSKQGVGRLWAWRPTLDARETASNTGQKGQQSKQAYRGQIKNRNMHLGYWRQAQTKHASMDHTENKKTHHLQHVPGMKLNQSVGRVLNQRPMLDAWNSSVQHLGRHKHTKNLHKKAYDL